MEKQEAKPVIKSRKKVKFSHKQTKLERKLEMEGLKKEIDLDDHQIPLEELIARVETDIEVGLNSQQVAEKHERDGKNCLTPPPQSPEWIKFVKQLTGWFSLLLWAGSILSFFAYILKPSDQGNLYLGIVLAFVVTVTGIFSYLQERKSANVMARFKNFLPTIAKALRDGNVSPINVEDLCMGDIVQIKGGDKIPADVRIIEATNFRVDNSSLTGEAEPQLRGIECTHDNPMETKNLAFYGTMATDGIATGIVITIGDNTIIGRIANLASGTANQKTTMAKEIDHFILIISGVAVFLGLSFLIMAFFLIDDWMENVLFMIGIIVSNVPEGLLATVTVSLTLTANRMAKRNVLVKNLESVETLGSTTVICSDKTGTLTQNRMTASHLWYDLLRWDCTTTTTPKNFEESDLTFKEFQRIATLCNKATFVPEDDEKEIISRRTIGDASESALIKFIQPFRDILEFRDKNKKVFEIPFNSTNKFQVSIHKLEDSGKYHLVMKGASERIFSRCSNILIKGQKVEITQKIRDSFDDSCNELANLGERVLGLCSLDLDEEQYPSDYVFEEIDTGGYNFPMENLTFVGLISLIDPPRESVPMAVQKCGEAGIRVIMVTGDHPATAKAIGRQVGIITHDTEDDIIRQNKENGTTFDPKKARAIVLHGQDIKDMTIEEWDRILDHEQIIFARTSPQQKLVIVENNQRRGEIVAVTGDGVNDSPALKKANIGIAMGISGSDVSKEAADMVLLDDNFSSIVNGIEEGRLIFDNLKKSIAYTLSSNIPEITPFLAFIILRIPLPLSIIMILGIDLGTDMVPAISLAYEKAESDIMQRKPRNAKTDNLVNLRLIAFSYLQIGVIQALAGFFSYFVVLGEYGFSPGLIFGLGIKWADPDILIAGKGFIYRTEALQVAQSAFFASIVIVQWADLLICKTRRLSIFRQGMKNKMMNIGLIFETILAALIIYIPFLNTALGTRPIPFVYWLPGLPFSLLIFVYDETRKRGMRHNWFKNWIEKHTYW